MSIPPIGNKTGCVPPARNRPADALPPRGRFFALVGIGAVLAQAWTVAEVLRAWMATGRRLRRRWRRRQWALRREGRETWCVVMRAAGV